VENLDKLLMNASKYRVSEISSDNEDSNSNDFLIDSTESTVFFFQSGNRLTEAFIGFFILAEYKPLAQEFFND